MKSNILQLSNYMKKFWSTYRNLQKESLSALFWHRVTIRSGFAAIRRKTHNMVKYDTRSLLQGSSKLQRCFKEMLLKNFCGI